MVDNPDKLCTICLMKFASLLRADESRWKKQIEQRIEQTYEDEKNQSTPPDRSKRKHHRTDDEFTTSLPTNCGTVTVSARCHEGWEQAWRHVPYMQDTDVVMDWSDLEIHPIDQWIVVLGTLSSWPLSIECRSIRTLGELFSQASSIEWFHSDIVLFACDMSETVRSQCQICQSFAMSHAQSTSTSERLGINLQRFEFESNDWFILSVHLSSDRFEIRRYLHDLWSVCLARDPETSTRGSQRPLDVRWISDATTFVEPFRRLLPATAAAYYSE